MAEPEKRNLSRRNLAQAIGSSEQSSHAAAATSSRDPETESVIQPQLTDQVFSQCLLYPRLVYEHAREGVVLRERERQMIHKGRLVVDNASHVSAARRMIISKRLSCACVLYRKTCAGERKPALHEINSSLEPYQLPCLLCSLLAEPSEEGRLLTI